MSRRLSSAINSEATSHLALSEMNPCQDISTFTSPGGFHEGVSLMGVFGAMANDLNEVMNKVSACEAEFNHISKQGNKRKSRSQRGSSQYSKANDEYMEILNKKGNVLEGISSIIYKKDLSAEIPKAKVHCYQKYASLLKQRYENTSQELNMLMEDMEKTKQKYNSLHKQRHENTSQDCNMFMEDVEKTKQECERLEQQVETFELLKNDEDINEGDEITQLFRELRTDMNTLLTDVFREDFEEFTAAMTQLTEAFMKNDSEEDHYVEISPETLQNRGIVWLMRDHVIVVDPSNPLKYRLNMAE